VIQTDINRHLLEWDKIAQAYRSTINAHAEAENTYRQERAKFIIRAKDADPKLSQAGAETLADADDPVMTLRLKKEAKAGEVEAYRQKLFWCRAKADSLRSDRVDEREANKLYSQHGGDA
jgi:hypothetical protein